MREKPVGDAEVGPEDEDEDKFEAVFKDSDSDDGERFLIKHEFRTEEDLFNGLDWCGKIVNLVRADGGELGDTLPRVVMVIIGRVNYNILNMTNMEVKRQGSWKPGQKWKILQEDCFRNVTEDLSEAHQRWDICGNEDVLNQLETLQVLKFRTCL